MNLFLSWVTFSVKKVSFPVKTAVLTVWQFFLWIPPRVSGLWPPLFWKCIDIIAFYRRFLYITSLLGMLQTLFLQEFKVHRFIWMCVTNFFIRTKLWTILLGFQVEPMTDFSDKCCPCSFVSLIIRN